MSSKFDTISKIVIGGVHTIGTLFGEILTGRPAVRKSSRDRVVEIEVDTSVDTAADTTADTAVDTAVEKRSIVISEKQERITANNIIYYNSECQHIAAYLIPTGIYW